MQDVATASELLKARDAPLMRFDQATLGASSSDAIGEPHE
jgi:uncharacterized protein HemX